MWPFAEICKHYWDCNTQTKSIFKATNDWDPLFLYRQKLFWKRIYTVHQIFYEIILYYQITLRKCVLFFVLFFFNFLSSCMLPVGEGGRNVKLRDLGSCIFDLWEIIQKSLKIHCWRINWISFGTTGQRKASVKWLLPRNLLWWCWFLHQTKLPVPHKMAMLRDRPLKEIKIKLSHMTGPNPIWLLSL